MDPRTILIVEDDGILALELQTTLKTLGYRVPDPVATGEAALAAAVRLRPDLVLMDIELPGGMNGIDAAARLREIADIPVVYLSAYSQEPLLRDARDTGPYGYLVKPVAQPELKVALEIALYKHSLDRRLKESEERFRTMADFTYDWEYWVSPSREIIYMSATCERITGYAPQAFYDDPGLLEDIVHPDDRNSLRRHMEERSNAPEEEEIEFRIIRRDGAERWIGHACNRVWDALGHDRGVRVSNRDITTRKRMEQELRLKQEWLGMAQHAAQAGFWDWDIPTGQLTWSPEFYTLFDLPESAAASFETWQAVMHPDDRQTAQMIIERALQERTPLFNEYRIIGRDGGVRWISALGDTTYDGAGRPQRMCGICIDITVRKQTEEELHKSEQRYGKLFENLLDGYAYCRMIFIDNRPVDFIYLDVNPRFETLTGLHDVIGHRVSEVIPGIQASSPELFEIYGRVALTGVPERFEIFLESMDIWFAIAVYSPEHGDFVAIFENITERRRIETALRSSEERFQKAFQNSGAFMAISTMEEGRIVEINDLFLATLGYERSEVIGRISRDLGMFADPAQRDQVIALLREQGTAKDAEVTLRTRYGELRTCLLSAEIIDLQGEPHLLTLINDVTEQRRAEEELWESERRYGKLFENLLDAYAYCRVIYENGRPVDFVCLDVNPVFLAHTGLQNVVGRKASEVMPAVHTTDPQILEHFGRVAQTGEPERFETYLISLGRWFSSALYSPEKGHVVAIFEDITARKHDAAVQQARNRLYTFADSHSLDELLEETLNEAERLTGSLIGFYHFVDPDQTTLTLQNWSTRTKRDFCAAAGKGLHYPIAQAGVWADAFRLRRPVIHNDYAALAQRKDLPPHHAPVTRELVVPVMRGDLVVAILGLGNKPHDYDGQDVKDVTLLADLVWDLTEHKRSAEALRESEARYRTVVETSPDPIVLYDLQGTFMAINRRTAEIYGVAGIEEFLALVPNISALLDDAGQNQAQRNIAGILENQRPVHSEYTLRRRDGTHIIAEVNSSLIRNTRGEPAALISIIHDITARKQAEETIREANARLEATLNALPDLLFEIDRRGRILAYRSQDNTALYLPPEKFIGREVEEVMPPATAGVFRQALADAIATGRHRGGQYCLPLPDGEHWYELSIAVKGDQRGPQTRYIVLARDITERRRAEAALRESEEKYRAIFENATEGIYQTTPEGRYVSVNPAFARILGYENTAEMINAPEPLAQRLYADPADRQRLIELLRQQGQVIGFEVQGHHKRVSINAHAVRDAQGEIRYIEGTMTDITERWRAQEALRESEAQLRAIFETAQSALFLGDAQGRILFANRRMGEMFGYLTEELIGRAYSTLLTPEVEPLGIASIAAIARGEIEKISAERRYLRKDGSAFWGYLSAGTLKDEQGAFRMIVGSIVDITPLKQAEDALRASEARVRQKLDCLLSPEGDIQDLELADIIDVPAIQSAMDFLSELTQATIAILDLKGRVLIAAGWQDICTRFFRIHGQTRQHCLESDLELSAGVEPGTYKLYRCKNNMLDIATPIMVGGQHLGNLYVGQFFFEGEEPDIEVFRAQARQYGFDEQAFLEALARVPRWKREKIRAIMHFFIRFADLIATLSFSNIKLARSVAQGERILASLAESEEKFRTLFTSMAEGMALHELVYAPDGTAVDYRILDVNPAYEIHTGLVRDQIMARTAGEIYGTDIPPFLGIYCAVAETGQPASFETFFAPTKKYLSVSVFSPGAGRFAIIFEDITERKRLQAEREQLATELQRKNKELEGIVYATSHDLRSPLLNIQGFSKRLDKTCAKLTQVLQDPVCPPEVREQAQPIIVETIPKALRFIRSSVEKMDSLIRGLLQLSRLGRKELTIETLDMRQLVEGIVASLGYQIQEAGARIEIGDLPLCRGDAGQVGQVFSNLIDNALKYRDHERELVITISGRLQGEHGVYCVSDNGLGIAPEHQDQIWELFHRLQPDGPVIGEGLGLTLVRRILERHGGEVWVESQAGAGSRFCFSLPRAGEGMT